ncbi:MAG: LysR family transcriptional regulator [Prevotella sp.]
MELRQLKYFLKVSETLNFSLASKELFITQSTLSQQISQLERELDQKLFQRNSHKVMLTEAGHTLLPLARDTVNSADACVLRLQELKAILVGELNIGVTFSFSSIATETLMDFLKKYPNVKLNVCYASMEELMDKLVRHELDFVLAFRPSVRDERIESHVLFNNRLAAIVNEQHPIAKHKSLIFGDIDRFDFALPAKGMQARNTLEKTLANTGHHFKVKIEMNNVHQLFKVIRESNYVTILSESTVIDERGLVAVPLDVPGNDMEGCIHVLKNSYMKASAREFIRMLGVSSVMRNFCLTALRG